MALAYLLPAIQITITIQFHKGGLMAKISQSTPVKDMVINQGEDYRFQLNLYTGTSVTDKQVLDITGFLFA